MTVDDYQHLRESADAASSVAPTCHAKLRLFDTSRGTPYCRRQLALRTLTDAQGITRYYCQAPGHRGLVVRAYGEWDEPESADPITASKIERERHEWVQHLSGFDLVIDDGD